MMWDPARPKARPLYQGIVAAIERDIGTGRLTGGERLPTHRELARSLGVTAKLLPFGEAEAGATGLELLLPLTLKWAAEMKVPLAAALVKVTMEPARILGIDAGHLSPGAAADLCIFDPDQYWKVEAAALKSQGKNTPFLGMELQGRVKYTLVNGNIVHQG